MATKNSFCLDEEELSCPICFEEFNLCEKNRQPKLLLCLHTFCLACVETLRKYDGSLQCSICRTSHYVYRVGDLMDNYVIVEYLRCKQEYEDGKLAAQLKEEYDMSLRLIKEQEEKDAHLARLEEEQIRAEAERERLRLEEVRCKEEKEREEERKREEEEEAEREFARQNQLQNIAQINYTPSVYESSTEFLVDVTSEEMTDSEKEDSEEEDGDTAEEEEDGSFQEFEGAQDEEEEVSSSQTSVVDMDAYETLSSDESDGEEHCSTEVISSDEEEEMGTALSTTAPLPSRNPLTSCDYSPSTSPEPDLLSEEFSGVAQTHHRAKPPPEALDKLLPSVKCAERDDSSIIILDSSLEEGSDIGTSLSQNPNRIILSRLTISPAGESEDDPGNYSSDEEAHVGLTAAGASQSKPFRMEQSVANARENDENCKLQ